MIIIENTLRVKLARKPLNFKALLRFFPAVAIDWLTAVSDRFCWRYQPVDSLGSSKRGLEKLGNKRIRHVKVKNRSGVLKIGKSLGVLNYFPQETRSWDGIGPNIFSTRNIILPAPQV